LYRATQGAKNCIMPIAEGLLAKGKCLLAKGEQQASHNS
jgi:hypothetical protein